MKPGDFPLVWDSSMLSDLKACPERARKKYVECWQGAGRNVHLHAGGAFARGLEVTRENYYVHGRSEEDSIALGLGALLGAYGDYEAPQDSPKDAIHMAGALEFYFSQYSLGDAPPVKLPSGKLGIEFNFAHPLPVRHPVTKEPLIFTGRLDAILNFAGSAWGFDEKTTTQLGGSWPKKWPLRGQFLGYSWGCREAGIPIAGVVVRGIAILKTEYKTAQAVNSYLDWQIDRWFQETCELLDEATGWWEGGKPSWRHNYDDACAAFSACPYMDACRSLHEEAVLETQFERRRWDPVTRTEVKFDD